MVFQRIFNAHTCLRQLRFVLNILPKLASLTCDQTQHRRFPSAHLKLHIISYYINTPWCMPSTCQRRTAYFLVDIDGTNAQERYLMTVKREFYASKKKNRQQIFSLEALRDCWYVLWGLYRNPSSH